MTFGARGNIISALRHLIAEAAISYENIGDLWCIVFNATDIEELETMWLTIIVNCCTVNFRRAMGAGGAADIGG